MNKSFQEIFSKERKNYSQSAYEKILNLFNELDNSDLSIMSDKIVFLLRELVCSEKANYELINKVINFYDDYINNDEKIDVLFHLYEKDSFKNYALKHFLLLKEQIEKIVIVTPDQFMGEFDDILDIQMKIGDDYKAYMVYWEFVQINAFNFYNLFRDVAKFYNFGKIVNDSEVMHTHMTSNENIINHFSEEGITIYEKIDGIEKIKLFLDEITENESKTLKFNDENIANYILKLLHEVNKKISYDSISLLNILNKVRDNIDENQYLDDKNNVFSLSYLSCLNYLKLLPKKDRKKNTLYLECFKIFLSEFLNNFSEEINEEDLLVIEALFQRIINGKNIFDIYRINNKKTLYHFYKTDDFIPHITISFDEIRKYNAKEYLKLKEEYKESFNKENLFYDKFAINEYKQKDKLLLLFSYLGYDFLNRSNIFNSKYLDYFSDIIKNNDSSYIIKLKSILVKDMEIVFDTKSNYRFDLILYVFDYLYKAGYPNITLPKIKKNIDSVTYILFPNNICISNNLEKLNLVHKGDPLVEKIKGIQLYDKYRFRINSSIPDVSGSLDDYHYSMVDMHDIDIISNGIGKYAFPNNTFNSSCLTPNGKASSCLFHGATNPNGRFFKVIHNGKIVAYSWVWRSGEVLCFDNIEVTEELLKNENYEEILYNIYKTQAEELISITKKYEKNGIKLVILGRNIFDIKNSFIDNLPKINDYTSQLFHPNTTEDIYLKDSEEKQLILGGQYKDNLNTEDVEPIYMYKRKKVKRFSGYDKKFINEIVNSIYFDYCLDNNIKYEPTNNIFVDGYFNEDWIVGIEMNGTRSFYYRGNDKRLFDEAKDYIKVSTKEKMSTNIIVTKHETEKVSYLLNPTNYSINYKKIKEYFANLEKQNFEQLTDYYFHSPSYLTYLSGILSEHRITSSNYGKRVKSGVNNGRDYVCVAKVGTPLFESYSSFSGFIISNDVLMFGTNNKFINPQIFDEFRNTSYPLRYSGNGGEYQVKNYISLDKAKCILSPINSINDIVRIIYLQEFYENNLPIVLKETNQVIDKEYVKQYVKLK